MKSDSLLWLLAAGLLGEVLHAADFQKTIIPGLQPRAAWTQRSLAWGDYDNDGDLDFIQTGDVLAQLWRNDGTGFTAVEIPGLPAAGNGFVAWTDVNQDGWLDLVHSGLYFDASTGVTGLITALWRNTGSGFVRELDAGLPTIFDGDVASADFDLDGRRDLLLVGSTAFNVDPPEQISGVWRNVGGRFVQVPTPGLPQVRDGSVAVADYDSDGRPDFLLMGLEDHPDQTSSLVTQLWRNTPGGFVRAATPGLPQLKSGQAEWADFNRDGRPDLVLTGLGEDENGVFGNLTRVWLNTESGFQPQVIPGFAQDLGWAVAALDHDNNGWPDFLVLGAPGITPAKTRLWQNLGTGFSQTSTVGVPNLNVGALAVADYDHDGRMDFLIEGFGGAGMNHKTYAELWRNVTGTTNAPPTAPAGLVAETVDGQTTLRWNAATDDHSPAVSLTYNLRVGTQPGGFDVVSPQSDPASGFRRIPAHGSVGWQTRASLRLAPGTYYASVQAVDANYAGSPFSAEVSFTVAPELRLTRPGGELQLHWPSLDSSWVLESADSPQAATWTPAASGTAGSYRPDSTAGQQFFRLRRSPAGP
jgi:hypothetical protein